MGTHWGEKKKKKEEAEVSKRADARLFKKKRKKKKKGKMSGRSEREFTRGEKFLDRTARFHNGEKDIETNKE